MFKATWIHIAVFQTYLYYFIMFSSYSNKLSLQRLKHAWMRMDVAISSSILTFGSSDI